MSFPLALFYATLASVAALAGTFLVFRYETWARRNSVFLISFATGVMLTIAFVNLIPESAELYSRSWLTVFAGFLALYVLQDILMLHPCHDEECRQHLGILSSVGMIVHAALDGIVISVGFEVSVSLGLLTALAVILHKMPDGITITSILMHTQMERKKIIFISVAVALVTPCAAAVSYVFLRDTPPAYLGMLLGATAGSFLYLAAAHLLPETHKFRHHANAFYLFGGILLTTLVEYFFH